MKFNNSDKFEVKNNLSNKQENFFLNEEFSASNSGYTFNSIESSRRLNDYDFNILQEDAYKEINDELFRLEYKLARIEEELKTVESQITVAREIADYNFIEELNNRKNQLQLTYDAILADYNNKSFSAKLSGSFTTFINNKTRKRGKNINANLSKLKDKILTKLPKSILSALELRRSLIKLESLNKSVDDLVSMNIPYGENYNKYDQLSKYIIKANSIQSEISKYLKK